MKTLYIVAPYSLGDVTVYNLVAMLTEKMLAAKALAQKLSEPVREAS